MILATLMVVFTHAEGKWKWITLTPAYIGVVIYLINFIHPYIFYISESNHWTNPGPPISVWLTWGYSILLWLVILARLPYQNAVNIVRDLMTIFLISVGFIADCTAALLSCYSIATETGSGKKPKRRIAAQEAGTDD